MYLCIYVYMYICIYVYMYICIYVYMYICIYVYMYISIYLYMYIYIIYIYIYPNIVVNHGFWRVFSMNTTRDLYVSDAAPFLGPQATL